MSDITLFERFVRVTQLLEPPSTLFAPAVARRVLLPQSSSEAPRRSAAAT